MFKTGLCWFKPASVLQQTQVCMRVSKTQLQMAFIVLIREGMASAAVDFNNPL